MKSSMNEVTELKASLKKKTKPKQYDLLSTGSTLLNLACSGKAHGGFPTGSYIFMVGDSMSGKTWLSLTCLAEAVLDNKFKDHRFIYDNVERGARMELSRFFGQKMVDRLEPPAVDDEGNEVFSTYVEEFYFYLDDAFKDGRPFIYVLDSMDGLDTF